MRDDTIIVYTSNLLTVVKNKRVTFITKGYVSSSYDELIETIIVF